MNNKSYSPKIAAAIRTYLAEENKQFRFDEDRGAFEFEGTLSGPIKRGQFEIAVNATSFTVYSSWPITADCWDEKIMKALAAYLHKVNFRLELSKDTGFFLLDDTDGETRYKLFRECYGIPPTSRMIRRNIQAAAEVYGWCGSGLLAVLFGDRERARKAAEEINRKAGWQEFRARREALRRQLQHMSNGDDPLDAAELEDESLKEGESDSLTAAAAAEARRNAARAFAEACRKAAMSGNPKKDETEEAPEAGKSVLGSERDSKPESERARELFELFVNEEKTDEQDERDE